MGKISRIPLIPVKENGQKVPIETMIEFFIVQSPEICPDPLFLPVKIMPKDGKPDRR